MAKININSVVSPDPVKPPLRPLPDVWGSLQRVSAPPRVSSDPSPPKVTFDPPTLNVRVGDEIFWANHDSEAHWPGLKNQDGTIDEDFFVPYPIAEDDTSEGFSPGVAATLEYVCSIHQNPPCSEAGTIEVT